MVFCVAWAAVQFDTLHGNYHASQSEVNRVIAWALAPYAIGRALIREIDFQRDD